MNNNGNKIKIFGMMMLAMMLLVTSIVVADSNNNIEGPKIVGQGQTTNINKNIDGFKITGQGEALTVRYEHMQCKIDFTNAQINIFKKYVPTVDLNANNLITDMTALKVFVDNGDKEGFNTYMDSTAKTNMQKITVDLNDVKKLKQYNLTNETRTAIITEFKIAKETYSECINDKELKIVKVMEIHMDDWNKQLIKINENMNKKNITTENMTEIMNEIDARNAKLRELIEAGNITTMKEFMKEYQQAQFHYMARFEIARLEGYKNKLEPLANKYNMTNKIHDIDEQIANAEKYAQEGRKYNEGERKQVWADINNAGKDMKETAKGINAERMKEKQGKIDERQQKIDEKQKEIQERDGRRLIKLNASVNDSDENESEE